MSPSILPMMWSSPPPSPTNEPGEAAVWLLDRHSVHPLETVLARYLDCSPASVLLHRSPAGKPELGSSTLRASLTRGGDVALVAVAHRQPVGVDIEISRSGLDRWSLPAHALTTRERMRLQRLPLEQRSSSFLESWTRKEALLKAAGFGLAVDPRFVELEGLSVVGAPPVVGNPRDWTLADLPVPGHHAALAVQGPLSRLALYDARQGE